MNQDIDKHWSNYYNQGKDFGSITSQALTKLLDFVDQNLPRTCLDIGCGTGQLTRELHHRGYVCVGIDASASAARLAKSLTVQDGLNYMLFNIEDEAIKSLPKQPYSLITCKLVYAFIKDKPNFLSKITNLLAERGTFVIITPLTIDVPPEKRDIAVDFDQTMVELRMAFKTVQTYKKHGITYFICSKQ
ncbi:MAG TPA: class I SAM-dependent methyltransferase [Candidatus Saccharimonadales bacterium]